MTTTYYTFHPYIQASETSATRLATFGIFWDGDAAVGDLSVSTSDSLTVTDVISKLYVNPLNLNVNDAISIAESITVTVLSATLLSVNVNDEVSVNDVISKLFVTPLNVDVSDSVTLAEFISVVLTAAGLLSVSVSDSITVADVINKIYLDPLVIDLSDMVAVEDVISNLYLTPLNLSVADAISIAEAIGISGLGGAISVNVFDGITITESATGRKLTLSPGDIQEIASAVWDKLLEDHKIDGSFGQAVNELRWRSR